MKKTTGTDRSITSKWRPATRAVRAGTWRSEQGETSEALFLTSGYSYDDAATADLVKGWLSYVTSAEGQEAAASDAGSAPLSEAVAAKVKDAVDSIAGA